VGANLTFYEIETDLKSIFFMKKIYNFFSKVTNKYNLKG